MARKEDPMSALLSDLGGIDAGLFQKRQAMRDMRSAPQAPSGAQASPSPRPSPQQPQAQQPAPGSSRYGQPAGGQSFRGPAVPQASPSPAQQQPAPAGRGARADGNRQLDALLGGDVLPKANRPMREAAKPARPAAAETQLPSWSSHPPAPASRGARPARASHAYSGSLGQDLDSVFGAAAGRGQPQAGAPASDPFALFGNLGTTEAAVSPPSADGDLLSDFASPGATRQASARSLATPPSVISHRRSIGSGGGSDDWGGMTAASPGLASPAYSSAQEDDLGAFARAAPREPPAPEPAAAPPARPQRAPPAEPPPPSYESVMRGRRSGSLSPRPRAQRYQAWQDEQPPQEGAGGRLPRSPDHRAGRQPAPQQEQIRDQAKQWLSAGQKWLSGAGKKVAAAVKETQAQLSSRLEELDVRGDGARPHPPPHPARSASLEGVPPYYWDWAETIRALPPHEQGPTLAAMPDEDARVIQRILRRPPGGAADAPPAAASPASPPPPQQQQQQRRAFSGELADQQRRPAPPRRSASSELSAGAADAPPARRAREPQRPAAAPAPSADLIGLVGEAQPRRPPAQPQPPAAEADLMGLAGEAPAPRPQAAAGAAAPPQPAADAGADLLGLSGGAGVGPSAAAAAPSPASASPGLFGSPAGGGGGGGGLMQEDLEAMFGNRPARTQGHGGDAMIDFGLEEAAAEPEWLQPSARDEEQEGEPEARKVARRRRLAETRARMQRQLADKQARDAAEAAHREAQHDLRARHRERVEAWKAGKKDNIRALLSSLHTVLWLDSGWSAPGMADLVEPPRVKRWYMKANLVVHPDKVRQRGGGVEQIVVADMAFDALKVAWGRFEATELRGR